MKKLVCCGIFFLCGMMSVANAATYNCQVQSLGALRVKSSNEYLYLNSAHKSTSKALVCGHLDTDGCDNGVTIFVTGQHWVGDKSVGDSRFYECATSGGNVWVDKGSSDLRMCNDTTGMRKIGVYNEKAIWVDKAASNRYMASGYYLAANMCFTDGDSGANASDENNKDTGAGGNGKGNGGKTGKGTGGNKGGKSDAGKPLCESSGGVWDTTKKYCSCDVAKNLELSGGLCKCKSGTNWIDEKDKKQGCKVLGGSDENELKNKCESAAAKESGAVWNETTKQCDCVDLEQDGKKYPRVFDAEKSQCVLDAKVDECLKIAGAFWSLNTGCACKDSTLEPDFSKMECVKTAETIKIESSVNSQKIISASSALQGLESTLGKVTVWKTADGKFNAARLASDLTAGVVLGTTGALVTSHLVKKKQVEDGFEDIQCTVGGQVVADWGDEFSVGMQ